MSKILIRPAQTTDKPAVAAISAQMWDNDYIPDVWAEPLLAGETSLRRLTDTDLTAAWALIDESPRHRATGELYEVSWKWKKLTRERLARHLAAGDVWGLDTGGELAGLAVTFQREDRDALCAGYVDGSGETLDTILLGLRGLAAQLGCAEMRFKPVNEPALVMAVEAADYEHSWDRDIWIFELELEGARCKPT